MEIEEVEAAKRLLLFIDTWKRILSIRFTMLLALLLTFALFIWAMWSADSMRLIVATVFAVLVFLPTWYLDIRDRAEIK